MNKTLLLEPRSTNTALIAWQFLGQPSERYLVMAAKKRSAKKASRKSKPRSVADRLLPILSTAIGSLFNMTMTTVTSGTVLLCLFAAKRWL